MHFQAEIGNSLYFFPLCKTWVKKISFLFSPVGTIYIIFHDNPEKGLTLSPWIFVLTIYFLPPSKSITSLTFTTCT